MVRTGVRLTFHSGRGTINMCDQSQSLGYQTMVTGGYPCVVGYLPSPGSQWTGRRAFTRSGESLMVRTGVRLTFHSGRGTINMCDQSQSLGYQTMVTGGYPCVVGYLPSPGSQWTGRRAFTRSGESLMVRTGVRLTFHSGRGTINMCDQSQSLGYQTMVTGGYPCVVGYLPSPGSQWTGRRAFTRSGESLMVRTGVRLTFHSGRGTINMCDQSQSLGYQTMVTGGYPCVVGYLPSPGSQWTGRRAFTRSGESLMVRTGVRLTFHSGRGTINMCDQSQSLGYQTMVTGGYPCVVGYLPSPGSQWTGRRAFTRSGESLMVRTGVRLTFHSGRGTINMCDQSQSLGYQTMVTGGYPCVVGYLPSPGSQWTGRRAFTRSGESLLVRTGVRLTFHSGRGTINIYIWVGSCWTIPGEIHGQTTTGLETAWSILQGIRGESHAARVIFMC